MISSYLQFVSVVFPQSAAAFAPIFVVEKLNHPVDFMSTSLAPLYVYLQLAAYICNT